MFPGSEQRGGDTACTPPHWGHEPTKLARVNGLPHPWQVVARPPPGIDCPRSCPPWAWETNSTRSLPSANGPPPLPQFEHPPSLKPPLFPWSAIPPAGYRRRAAGNMTQVNQGKCRALRAVVGLGGGQPDSESAPGGRAGGGPGCATRLSSCWRRPPQGPGRGGDRERRVAGGAPVRGRMLPAGTGGGLPAPRRIGGRRGAGGQREAAGAYQLRFGPTSRCTNSG